MYPERGVKVREPNPGHSVNIRIKIMKRNKSEKEHKGRRRMVVSGSQGKKAFSGRDGELDEGLEQNTEFWQRPWLQLTQSAEDKVRLVWAEKRL